MIRTLFVTFFMATSVILYTDGRSDSPSNEAMTPLSISHQAAVPIKVKTVSKRFTKVAEGRRFTRKEDIAAQLELKHRHNLKYAQAKAKFLYPAFASQEPAKKLLNANNKHRIAIKIKSELKRVGCFRGVISGSWNKSVSSALSHFNISTQQNLKTIEPNLESLAILQGYSARACRSNYRMVQRKKPLIVAQLPVRRPLSNFQTAVVEVEPAKIEPATSSMSSEVFALASIAKKPALKRKKVKKSLKRRSRKIARFQQDEILEYDNFYTPKRRRPKASTVGRRLVTPSRKTKRAIGRRLVTPSRKTKRAKRRARRHARLSAKRKHRAKKRRYRKSRRRYRRYRRRFGFSHNGELGYW